MFMKIPLSKPSKLILLSAFLSDTHMHTHAHMHTHTHTSNTTHTNTMSQPTQYRLQLTNPTHQTVAIHPPQEQAAQGEPIDTKHCLPCLRKGSRLTVSKTCLLVPINP